MRYRAMQGKRRAFTLIEMLIVIACIAVVAMIVYPHFADAQLTTEENAHRDQLETIRRQIQIYRGQHDGQLPDLRANWDALTQPHTYRGRTVGPYLVQPPVNHKRSNLLDGLATDGQLPGNYGYVYDYRNGAGTGRIWATNGSGKKLRKW